MRHRPQSTVQDLLDRKPGQRVATIKDVIVYPRARLASCTWCWEQHVVNSVEISYVIAQEARTTRWCARSLCRECREYIIHLADGNITYCPF